MIHRRFARMLEFDRNGPPLSGTPELQAAIRDTIKRHAVYGSPFDQTLYRLDQAVNRNGRNFIPVGFADMAPLGLLGFCWPTYLQLHEGIHPDWIEPIFLHELGHLFGWHALDTTDTSEGWATGFQQWISQGQNEDSPVWERINAST
jgi:hypothetical protein